MADQDTLFPLAPAPAPKVALPKRKNALTKIGAMWARYGKDSERRICGHCAHLLRVPYHGKTYLKCDLTQITHGVGSDWRAGWIACGKFTKRSNP